MALGGGSAGTLVGAALQTAGQFYQSYAIDSLLGPLINLPVLIFVIAAVSSMAVFVFTGQLRGWLTFVLGPCLFFAIILQRGEIPSVTWIYGDEPQDDARVVSTSESMVPDKIYKPFVSSLFSGYDRVVSAFVAQTVAGLNAVRTSGDQTMVVREQLLGYMMSPEVTDPGLSELLHLSLLGECRAMVQAGQEMADTRNPAAERCEWAKAYEQLAISTQFHLTAPAVKYLATVMTDVPDLFHLPADGEPVTYDLGTEMTNTQANIQAAGFNCPLQYAGGVQDPIDATAIASDAVRANAFVREEIAKMIGVGTDGLPRTSNAVDVIVQTDDARQAEIEAKAADLSAEAYTCHEIWDFVYAGLIFDAAMTEEVVKGQATAKGIDPDDLIDQLSNAAGAPGAQELMRAIARRAFRFEEARGSTSAMISEYSDRGPDLNNIEVTDSDTYENQIKHSTQEQQWLGQATLIQTAYMLPYYQGLLLFVLSMGFPFFAMLLFVPGRAQAFLLWFALWFWVKSWDIGYAIASMLDDVLYTLFVVKMDSGYLTAKTTLDLDFSSALSALRDADPTFDITTYYAIMSVVLLAVPVVTAQFVVASAFGIANILRAGTQESAARVGAKATELGVARWFGMNQSVNPVKTLVDGAANKIGSIFDSTTGQPIEQPSALIAPPPVVSTFDPATRTTRLLPNKSAKGLIGRNQPAQPRLARWGGAEEGPAASPLEKDLRLSDGTEGGTILRLPDSSRGIENNESP